MIIGSFSWAFSVNLNGNVNANIEMVALCDPLGGVSYSADITIACLVLPEHVQKRNYT